MTPLRVAYLGPAGTHSHEALLSLPEAIGWALCPETSIHAAVVAVHSGAADRALVPIENSLEGSVNVTLDTLVQEAVDVQIAGEVVHAVHHSLITAAPVELGSIRLVRSHAQATGQCAEFLRRELPTAVVSASSSTAEAVREVVEGADRTAAALGSSAAAMLYGGHVLCEDVEDVAGNQTRFAWLAPVSAAGGRSVGELGGGGTAWKTAIVWWGAGSTSPGWLVRCLSEFAFRGVNLTRIESRPRRIPGIGEYMFFADLAGQSGEEPVAEALTALRGHADEVRLLGSFPVAD